MAGTAAALLLWAAGTLAAPRRANPLLEMAKAVSALAGLGTLLPWPSCRCSSLSVKRRRATA